MHIENLLRLKETQDLPLARRWMCDYLEGLGIDFEILRSLRHLPRHAFVPPNYQRLAYADLDLWLPNAFLPSARITARVLSFLRLDSSHSVLELITGTGYQTSLLGSIVSQVHTVDPYFHHFYLSSNVSLALGLKRVSQRVGSAIEGLAAEGPFDAIIFNASLPSIPTELLKQLRAGTGALVVPVGPETGPQRLLGIRQRNASLEVTDLGAVAYPALAAVSSPSSARNNQPLHLGVIEAQVEPVVEAQALPIVKPVVEAQAFPIVGSMVEAQAIPIVNPIVEAEVNPVVRLVVEAQAVPQSGDLRGFSKKTISLAFGGDIALAGSVAQVLRHRIDPFFGISDILSVDVALANLESPLLTNSANEDEATVTDDSAPIRLVGRYFSALSVANDCFADSGVESLLATIEHLKETHVAAFGGGSSSDVAFRPAVLEHGSVRVAIFGFNDLKTSSMARKEAVEVAAAPDANKLARLFNGCRTEGADLSVAFCHWGEEYKATITARQREFGHALVDAGADLVVGCGSHLVQGIETYKGRLIAYGLGNLIADNMPDAARNGMLLRILGEKEGFFQWEVRGVVLDSFGLPHPVSSTALN